MPRFALAALAAAPLLLSACCDRAQPRPPIAEISTTAAAVAGFDDPSAVAPDALTTPAAGAREPLVVVTIFSDYQCPFCRDSARIADKLLTHWPDAVQVQYRQLPLEAIHPLAKPAAVGALAAHRQGAFACFSRALFGAQKAWRRDDDNAFRGRMTELAHHCGLDPARFTRDLDDPALARAVDADVARARELSVSGTPSYLVNGRAVPPRVTPKRSGDDTVTAAVRRELAEAQRVVAQGGDRATQLRERVSANTGLSEAAGWLLDNATP